MIIILKMNPAAYSSKLQGLPTAPRCAICRSDVVCLLTGINYTVRRPKSHNCYLLIVLATVPDRHFGYGSGSKPDRCQIGGTGCHQTRTVNSGTVQR